MRLNPIIHAVLLICFAAAAPAAAQDQIASELQRKARAGEKDDGFCGRVAGNLGHLDDKQVRARINELLSRSGTEAATMLFVTGGRGGQPIMCFFFVFQPSVPRQGKRCRDSEVFGCVGGRDCYLKNDEPICEVKPGVWD